MKSFRRRMKTRHGKAIINRQRRRGLGKGKANRATSGKTRSAKLAKAGKKS